MLQGRKSPLWWERSDTRGREDSLSIELPLVAGNCLQQPGICATGLAVHRVVAANVETHGLGHAKQDLKTLTAEVYLHMRDVTSPISTQA